MKLNRKICTIGGGSGMPIVNRALIRAGFRDIHSIVTTFDSGGDTGRMRTDERGKLLAFSDYWRSLISLWVDGEQKEVWEEMLRFRDGRNRNFGNIFFQFMSEKVGNLSGVDMLFSKLIGAKIYGEVIPVSTEPAEVCFKTKSGKIYCGENYLDELRMSRDVVKKIWLEPEIKVNQEVIEALISSEIIIICPGSMYGSVITNLLPNGVVEAYKKSKAKKVLMTNITSVANENDSYDQEDYVNKFEEYLGTEKPFDLILMPDLSKLDKKLMKKVLKNYELENSKPILTSNRTGNYEVMVADIATIEPDNLRLRHSVTKLANFFKSIIF